MLPDRASTARCNTYSIRLNGYGVSYFGAHNGAIDLTVTGGTPPYTYQWSNEATTQDLSGLSQGYYEVVVTDAGGESADDRVTLEAPEELQVFLSKYEYANEYNVYCYGCFNGSIDVSVIGGLPPYSYLWADGTTAEDRNFLGARDYQVTVTDANGSVVESEHVELRQPDRDDWTMSGNYGTNPAINYVGSADNKDVVFKSNGQERVRLLSAGDIKMPGLGSTFSYSPLVVDSTGVLKSLANLGDPPLGANGCPKRPLPWTMCGNEIFPDQFLGTTNERALRFRTHNVERMFISADGKVGIGTVPPSGTSDFLLFVADGIATNEVKVTVGAWPDYVFEEEYELLPLEELRKFIHLNKHLPGVPSAREVEANEGIELGAMQGKLLKVVEEQALYILELEERYTNLEKRIRDLEVSKNDKR